MGTLPQLIEAYARRALPTPPPEPRGTIVHQRGEIRLAPERAWMPFTAEQTMDASRCGFVWHARFKMAPLLTGVVEDAYEDGRGRLDAKIWGVIPVAHARGLEVDRGEAQRYLAELVWCPMALRHNPELHYEAVDARTVRVWTVEPQTYVDLAFDEAGDVCGASTTTRMRGDAAEPWHGRFWGYRDFGGIRAPAHAEVAWGVGDARFVYWRGEITSLALHTP